MERRSCPSCRGEESGEKAGRLKKATQNTEGGEDYKDTSLGSGAGKSGSHLS